MNDDVMPQRSFRKPLLLGCSAGGGHNAAIQGIAEFLKKNSLALLILKEYQPIPYKGESITTRQQEIEILSTIMGAVGGTVIKKLVDLLPIPQIPGRSFLRQEINSLNDKNKNPRPYIDMLLDVFPAGYESAAIWNILQRNDQTNELKKSIQWQPKSDKDNSKTVYEYFFNALERELKEDIPFTEIISTQALALPTLCDVVKDYNRKHNKSIVLHQYLTDLPTLGAVHFFEALAKLTPEQQQQMELYGVDLERDGHVMRHFFPKGHHFKAVHQIESQKNPMIREGFKQPINDNSDKFKKGDTVIKLQGEEPITIPAMAQIASIMLGSQAGYDSISYIETLLEQGMDKVFVFGGKNDYISEKIDGILKNHPEYEGKIVRLGNQGAPEVASLLSRSNIMVIRGGGLSVMEQMAMPHNKEQMILLHHANASTTELSSGISWEDGNVDILIATMKQENIYARKVSPDLAMRAILERRIAVTMGSKVDIEALSKLPLSISTMKQCTKWLNENNIEAINSYFQCNKKDNTIDTLERRGLLHIETLMCRCEETQNYLAQLILAEAKKCKIQEETIEQITHQVTNEPVFVSSALKALVTSYTAVKKLQQTLDSKHPEAFITKLVHFKNTYSKVKEEILAYNDSKIKQFINEIIYQLVLIFGSEAQKSAFFTPVQNLRKDVHELSANFDEDDDLSPKIGA